MTKEDLQKLAAGGKICALTGHRKLGYDFDETQLKEIFVRLIGEGFTLFLSGMAVGFDTACCRVLYKLRETFDIAIVACIPFAGQEEKFSPRQKEVYKNYVEASDGKVVLYPRYQTGCYFVRNRYMADMGDLLIAYLREEKGGTFYTVNYAKSKNIRILYV